MDITSTLAPNSDQLDAIELIAGPRTFQIESVSKGNAEQPVQVHLVDFPRPWRPGKNMRRILAACWGADASQWTGRRVTLFYDPAVTFGKETPGGTRISALSHINGPQKVTLLVSRGKSAVYVVQPLADAHTPAKQPTAKAAPKQAPEDTDDVFADMDTLTRFLGTVESATTADELRALYRRIPELLPEEQYADAKQAINARSEQIGAAA